MAVPHVVLALTVMTLVTYCACLPTRAIAKESDSGVQTTNTQIVDERKDELELVKTELKRITVNMDSVTSDSVVNRIKRDLINGHNCPSGHGMAPSGECTPCEGRILPGCPTPTEEDYDNY